VGLKVQRRALVRTALADTSISRRIVDLVARSLG
jgi:hypothetical protein